VASERALDPLRALHNATANEDEATLVRCALPANPRADAAHVPRSRAAPHTLTARRSTPARSALVSLANSTHRITPVRSTPRPAPSRAGTACTCEPPRTVRARREGR